MNWQFKMKNYTSSSSKNLKSTAIQWTSGKICHVQMTLKWCLCLVGWCQKSFKCFIQRQLINVTGKWMTTTYDASSKTTWLKYWLNFVFFIKTPSLECLHQSCTVCLLWHSSFVYVIGVWDNMFNVQQNGQIVMLSELFNFRNNKIFWFILNSARSDLCCWGYNHLKHETTMFDDMKAPLISYEI